MRKILAWILIAIAFIFLIATLVIENNHKNTKLEKIKVAEVTHSIFYAPQYVAIKNGYFEDAGLDIDLVLTPGADKVASAVLSGDVQIGLSGSEATIYVYNGGEKDYLKTFAGLTNKDGSFLVGREKDKNFTIDKLKGKHVIAGRVNGMPVMNFEWALRNNNIDPKNDLNVDTSIEFASMQGAFISGIGDYVSLFEPNASQIEKEGLGYKVASIGKLAGNIPYTSYSAKKSYIKDNDKIIKSFTTAVDKGLEYVSKNDSKKIAKLLVDFFPDTSLTDIENAVQSYKDIDAWQKTTEIKEEDFDRIQDIMIDSKAIDKKVDYDKLIETKYFKKR